MGFSANGSMTEVDDAVSLAVGTFRLQMEGYPDQTLEFNHESKALMDYKTKIIMSSGDQVVKMNVDVTTVKTDDSNFCVIFFK